MVVRGFRNIYPHFRQKPTTGNFRLADYTGVTIEPLHLICEQRTGDRKKLDRRGTRFFEKGALGLARDQSRTKSDGARTLPVINPRQTEDLFIGSRRTINGDR
jgi:hypothetical protein